MYTHNKNGFRIKRDKHIKQPLFYLVLQLNTTFIAEIRKQWMKTPLQILAG